MNNVIARESSTAAYLSVLTLRRHPGRVGALGTLTLIDSRPLESNDIINLDLTIYLDGFHGDTSATFLLPDVDKPGRDLVAATEEALYLAIRACKPGERYNEMGKTIE